MGRPTEKSLPALGFRYSRRKGGSGMDEIFMQAAIEQARQAAAVGEVPVGAVVVREGKILSFGKNRRETDKNALAHAELEAISAACAALGGWRLSGCTLYVTLEPCPMCAGAIINARLDRVVFGAYDRKAGSVCSMQEMFAYPSNHRPDWTGGVLEEACAGLLSDFFRRLRTGRKACAGLGEHTGQSERTGSNGQNGQDKVSGTQR